MKFTAYKAVELIFMSVFSLAILIVSILLADALIVDVNDNLTYAGHFVITAIATGLGAKLGQIISHKVIDKIEDELTARAIRNYDNDKLN